MTSATYPLTLFFDGQCPVCRTEMQSLRQRDTAGRLRFDDVRAEGFAVPAGTTLDHMLASIHARTADGRIVAGVETLRLAYRAVGLGWLVAPTTWPGLRGASERGYLWVARHRFAMPSWLGLAGLGLRSRKAHCTDSTCSL
jgi:predicted DCC family thiol-disulfide oxidoreductase YuxK